jgi:UDP-glucose 4-epimerase
MSRVLVTGANGFVGEAFCRLLMQSGHTVCGLVRQAGQLERSVSEWVESQADFAGVDAGRPATLQVDCVLHLAARVHVMRDTAADPDAAFHATNVEGALRVAKAAWRHGARRFVFASIVTAPAERDAGRPLREDVPPTPQDVYGRSKLAAEQALMRNGEETGLEVVIVRLPLVYGPRVRANFLRLMDVIWKGVPLPLGVIDARRSLVYAGNLADALTHCATDPRAARQTFHVADSDALTVAEVARSLGGGMCTSPPAYCRCPRTG